MTDLNQLLEQQKFKWVKTDLLPLLGLLDFFEDSGNGFFFLTTSKENLIRNLRRVEKIPELIIKERLEKFEKEFESNGFIRVEKGKNYEYWTSYTYKHNSVCKNSIMATTHYVLTPELMKKSLKALQDLDFDINKIFKDIISNIKTINDLLYIGLLKRITERFEFEDFYKLNDDGIEDLKVILEMAGIDNEFIDYILDQFELNYESLNKYLTSVKKWIYIFYSHDFNSNSCYRKNNIVIDKRIANDIKDELEKIPIFEIIAKSYKNIKDELIENKKKIPLFGIKDYRFKFMVEFHDKLINKYKRVFDFEIDNEELKKALEYFKEKKIIKVKDDELIIISEDKYYNLYYGLKDKEYQRIEKNKKELFIRWINSDVNLQELMKIEKERKVELILDKKSELEIEPKLEPVPIINLKKTSVSGFKEKDKIIIGSEKIPKQWGILGRSNEKSIIFDLNAPHIVFVSGMMGAGKGYTIGVISEMLVSDSIENISKIDKKATIIVLYKPRDDVPSEFWSIRYANDNLQEIENLKAYQTEPKKLIEENRFKIFLDPIVYSKYSNTFKEEYQTQNISPLYIDPSTLIAEDWGNALAIGEGSNALYTKTIFRILRHLPAKFNLYDIKNRINQSKLTKTQKELAINRLEILEDYFKTDDFINELVIGGVNIIDFRKCMFQPDDIFTIMTLIISKLQNKKEFENEPFVFVINEAHMYFKKGISKEFVNIIENLIRRKRHGANWLLLDTHLPTDVDSKIIELSDIKIIHFTDKTVELPILRRILEGSEDKIYELKTGECIILSDKSSIGLSKPIKVMVRPRITKHGGATKTAIK
ncbi:MAG: hypothetical protein ACTSQP_23125 [Promethearchaeota archaeon]